MLSGKPRSFIGTILTFTLSTTIAAPSSAEVPPTGSTEPPASSRPSILDGIRKPISSKIILMPVVDKSSYSGSQGAFKDFTTEVLNQAIRNSGVRTLPWFKVSKALEQEVYGLSSSGGSGSPFRMVMGVGLKQDLTSDLYISEMISAGSKLRANYIIRPVILKLTTSSKVDTKRPTCLPIFGCVNKGSSTMQVFGEADIKVDVISIRQQDIIASRTFSGRSVEVTKERLLRIDAVVGSQAFSSPDCSGVISDKDICNDSKLKLALYDTVDKIVEFVDLKVN